MIILYDLIKQRSSRVRYTFGAFAIVLCLTIYLPWMIDYQHHPSSALSIAPLLHSISMKAASMEYIPGDRSRNRVIISTTLSRSLQQEDTSFASCADGINQCQNGGNCVIISEIDQYLCDCSNAKDENGTVYVGKWCHLPPQTYCIPEETINENNNHNNNQNGNNNSSTGMSNTTSTFQMFCVNNGTCAWDEEKVTSCDCTNDFAGTHCEYSKSDVSAVINEKDPTNTNKTIDGQEENDDVSVSSTQSKPDLQDCTLDCQHGQCMVDSSNAFSCACFEGYTGTYCEEIELLGTPCGQGSCFHGSTCVRTMTGEYACDCPSIKSNNDYAGSISVKSDFAGRWCQFEATSYCDADNTFFCVNNGTCVGDEGNGDGVFFCKCDETKWTGPMCEFAASNEKDDLDLAYENCKLMCLNGGQCRKGAKEDFLSNFDGDNDLISPAGSSSVFNRDFEHCVCPKGYTGLACEHEYEKCGNGEHFCLHGSTCVQSHDRSSFAAGWSCNCQDASSADTGPFAGEYCQHHATMLCTDKEFAANPSLYDPTTSSFCVNDGICDELGCICKPGYTGAHCELLNTMQATMQGNAITNNDSEEKAQDAVAILFLCFVLGTILVFLIVVFLLRLKGLRDQELKALDEVIARSHLQQITPRQSAVMEEVDFDPDFDERYLEEVELL